MLGAFLLPCVAILFIVRNQYIQFKYLTFFIPLFAIAWMLSLDKAMTKLKAYVVAAVLIIVMAVFVLIPLRSYRLYASLLDYQLQELNILHDKYATQGRTLFLSREDWLQYFIDSGDDYVPLTLYIPLAYSGKGLDYIIIDSAYPTDVNTYLESEPQLKQIVDNASSCKTNEFSRYTVIDVNCFDENSK